MISQTVVSPPAVVDTPASDKGRDPALTFSLTRSAYSSAVADATERTEAKASGSSEPAEPAKLVGW